jgi:hypothetical protein
LSGSSQESQPKAVEVNGTPVIYLVQTKPTAAEGKELEKTVVADDEVVSSGENDNTVEKVGYTNHSCKYYAYTSLCIMGLWLLLNLFRSLVN